MSQSRLGGFGGTARWYWPIALRQEQKAGSEQGESTMSTTAHLWAVGYDDMDRADQVRDVIAELGWGSGNANRYLTVLDLAVVVRHPDGSYTVNRHPFPSLTNIVACTGAGFLAGLVLAAPLTGAALGALLGSAGTVAGTVAAGRVGIHKDFVRDVEALMKPGTSALFVLDDAVDMEVILHTIRGLGGTVLKTNVDLERVRLIQSELAAAVGSRD
jgi:uncharacterized membrane protein